MVGIFKGNLHHEAGFGELTVHEIFQIVRSAVFEEKKLLGHQVPVIGDTVVLRSIFI